MPILCQIKDEDPGYEPKQLKSRPDEHKLGLLLAQEEVGQHKRERLQRTRDNPEELPP